MASLVMFISYDSGGELAQVDEYRENNRREIEELSSKLSRHQDLKEMSKPKRSIGHLELYDDYDFIYYYYEYLLYQAKNRDKVMQPTPQEFYQS